MASVDITGLGSIVLKQKQQPHYKQSWHWAVRRKADIVALMTALRPYLVVKAHRADAFLQEVAA